MNTLFGYKKCSTCRDAHKFLQAEGMEVEFHDFVQDPPSREQLASWAARYGQGLMPFVNIKGTRFKELELKNKQLSQDEWYKLLTTDGKLLKRPVLVTEREIVVGFDKQAYGEILHRGK